MQERRTTKRIRIDLKARWEALISEGRGSICDLSAAGCFVLTGGEFINGQLIRLEIHFPSEVASVWGSVIYSVPEMGLAVRFALGNDSEMQALRALIDKL